MASQDIANKKLIAGLLGILLGAYGIHKFYLGYKNEGIIMLAVTLGSVLVFLLSFLCCVGVIGFAGIFATSVIGLIEGIMYILKTDDEFEQTYIINKRPWF